MNACSVAGRLEKAASEISRGATPSWARAVSIDVRKSALLGAMLPGGLSGGRMPAAPAGRESAVPMRAVHMIAAVASPPRTGVRDRRSLVRPMEPTCPLGDTVVGDDHGKGRQFPFRQPGSLKESRSFASPPRERFALVLQSMPEDPAESTGNLRKRGEGNRIATWFGRCGKRTPVEDAAPTRCRPETTAACVKATASTVR